MICFEEFDTSDNTATYFSYHLRHFIAKFLWQLFCFPSDEYLDFSVITNFTNENIVWFLKTAFNILESKRQKKSTLHI